MLRRHALLLDNAVIKRRGTKKIKLFLMDHFVFQTNSRKRLLLNRPIGLNFKRILEICWSEKHTKLSVDF